MIHTQLEMGIKPAVITVGLHRSASTLSRELRRNGWTRPKARRGPGRLPMAGGYRADAGLRVTEDAPYGWFGSEAGKAIGVPQASVCMHPAIMPDSQTP